MGTVELMLLTLAIGLVAGLVGGLAGIGGSIIMIPALGLFLGYQTPDKSEQHLYQAVAMMVNVVVAWASTRSHQGAGVTDPGLRRWLLPGMIVGMAAGVLLSEQLTGRALKLGLVGFLWVYCAYNAVTAVLARSQAGQGAPAAYDLTPRRRAVVGTIGGLTGFPSGVLGIGGGIVMIPLMQVWAKVPLKRAIAASAGVMWISSMFGASLKVVGLHQHGQSWTHALMLAAPMALGAFGGSRLGGMLTHRLKLSHLKLVISALLAVSGLRLAGIL